MENKLTHFRITILSLLCAFTAQAEVFSIQPQGKDCKILYGNETVVESISGGLNRLDNLPYEIMSSDTTLQDGRRIYNVWSTDKRLAFRM